VVKESRPLVREDWAAQEARRLSTAQKKEEKNAAKKRQVKKTLECEALKKRRCQQSLEGLLIEESPSKMVSGEDEDNSNDVGSQYDIVTFLAHLLDVRPLLEPIGGSTSQALREVSAPVEGEGESVEGTARVGPSERGSTSPRVPWGRLVAPRP
jgi:hypothetical protein